MWQNQLWRDSQRKLLEVRERIGDAIDQEKERILEGIRSISPSHSPDHEAWGSPSSFTEGFAGRFREGDDDYGFEDAYDRDEDADGKTKEGDEQKSDDEEYFEATSA